MKLDEITVAFQLHDVFINSSDCFRFSERNHLFSIKPEGGGGGSYIFHKPLEDRWGYLGLRDP